jgi:hypothetical protein
MDRSPGFGSNPQYYFALFRLAFATATPLKLNLALQINSLAHYAKGTLSPNPKIRLELLVGNWFQVLLHSPNRGSFHLSLTVLVRYRSSGSI